MVVMWLRRTVNFTDLQKLFAVKVIPKGIIYTPNSRYVLHGLSKYGCYGCRSLSTSVIMQNKPRYVYDPDSDSFVQKHGGNIGNNNDSDRGGNQNKNDNGAGNLKLFLKRFTRNLFLLTGGIIWTGAILIALFVDIKESTEFVLQLKDGEEEVRLFAFYDIAQSKTELANILSKDKHYDVEEIDVVTRMKEFALYNALSLIKNQEIIIETLGKPVQLTGYRAAAKLDRMIQNFQNLTQFGLERYTSDDTSKYKWTAECLLEGPKGLASLILEFERPAEQNEWVLSKVVVDTLEKSGNHILDLTGSLPEGVKLSD